MSKHLNINRLIDSENLIFPMPVKTNDDFYKLLTLFDKMTEDEQIKTLKFSLSPRFLINSKLTRFLSPKDFVKYFAYMRNLEFEVFEYHHLLDENNYYIVQRK